MAPHVNRMLHLILSGITGLVLWIQSTENINKYRVLFLFVILFPCYHQVSVTDLITVVAISSAMSVHPCVDSNNNKYKCSHLCVISSENTSLAECSCPIGLIDRTEAFIGELLTKRTLLFDLVNGIHPNRRMCTTPLWFIVTHLT